MKVIYKVLVYSDPEKKIESTKRVLKVTRKGIKLIFLVNTTRSKVRGRGAHIPKGA